MSSPLPDGYVPPVREQVMRQLTDRDTAMRLSRAAGQLVRLSQWVDQHPRNAERDPEALGWHRVTKVAEEAGEAVGAWLLYTGGNPRKDLGPLEDVIGELYDTAVAALGAVEHLTGHQGTALAGLVAKIDRVATRAGVA